MDSLGTVLGKSLLVRPQNQDRTGQEYACGLGKTRQGVIRRGKGKAGQDRTGQGRAGLGGQDMVQLGVNRARQGKGMARCGEQCLTASHRALNSP